VRDLNLEHERLQAKLQTEVMQRKKLHNIIEDMKGKIRVFCRVRPLSNQEQSLKSASIIKVADEYTLKFRVMQEGKQTGSEQEFNFDSCFGAFSSQEEVF
jgi:hypothetical protein